jgi:hypothetical protein
LLELHLVLLSLLLELLDLLLLLLATAQAVRFRGGHHAPVRADAAGAVHAAESRERAEVNGATELDTTSATAAATAAATTTSGRGV